MQHAAVLMLNIALLVIMIILKRRWELFLLLLAYSRGYYGLRGAQARSYEL